MEQDPKKIAEEKAERAFSAEEQPEQAASAAARLARTNGSARRPKRSERSVHPNAQDMVGQEKKVSGPLESLQTPGQAGQEKAQDGALRTDAAGQAALALEKRGALPGGDWLERRQSLRALYMQDLCDLCLQRMESLLLQTQNLKDLVAVLSLLLDKAGKAQGGMGITVLTHAIRPPREDE